MRKITAFVCVSVLLSSVFSCVACGEKDSGFSYESGSDTVLVESDEVNKDTVIDGSLTIPAGMTLTVKSGVSFSVETGANVIVAGSLIYENESDSIVKGKITVCNGGIYSDENTDADWKWEHATLTGDLYINKGGKLYLNNAIYVGNAEDGGRISILEGNYLGESNENTERFRINKDNVYLYNGVFSLNKKLNDTRVWNMGGDTYLYLDASNKIKFVGPSENRKARIMSRNNAENTHRDCVIDANKGYSWLESGISSTKNWCRFAPVMQEGKLDATAMSNMSRDASIDVLAYRAANDDTFIWNGKTGESGDGYNDEAGKDGKRYSNLKYTDRGGTRDEYDLYVPSGYEKGADIPLVLFVHGGSWLGGSKENMTSECIRFAKRGYLAATVNTRLAGLSESTHYPQDDGGILEMRDDVYATVAAIKEKIKELGFKCSGMAISGNSSGANVGMVFGYTYGLESPIPVKLALPMCGPSDFHADSWQYSVGVLNPSNNKMTDDELLRAGAVLGGGIASAGRLTNQEEISALWDKLYEAAKNGTDCDDSTEAFLEPVSPAMLVYKHKVPTVGFYGGMDTTVHPKNFKRLQNALIKNGVDNLMIFSPLCTHSLIEDVSAAETFYKVAFEYMEKYVRAK